MKAEGVISQDNRPFKGKPRAKQVVNIDRIPGSNSTASTLFGDEALRVESNPDYIFRKVKLARCRWSPTGLWILAANKTRSNEYPTWRISWCISLKIVSRFQKNSGVASTVSLSSQIFLSEGISRCWLTRCFIASASRSYTSTWKALWLALGQQ